MQYPEAEVKDIEQNQSIDILVRVESVRDSDIDQIDRKVSLIDRFGERTQLTIFENDSENYNLGEENWYVLRNASGNIHQGSPELRSNFGKMEVTPVETPSAEFAPVLRTEEEREELRSGGIVALDIETLSTVPESELDLQNPEHVEILCVALGYRPEPGMPVETTVLFRQDTHPDSEVSLVEGVCDWIQRRDPSVLLTYMGTDFDIVHLCERPELVGDSPSPFYEVLETVEHHDIDRGGKLIDVADVEPTYWDVYKHSLEPRQWRTAQGKSGSNLTDPKLDGGDIPYFGERYLELREQGKADSAECRALHEMIRRYATEDIRPLFELYED